MSITLRTVKGQALTYDEMDRNFSQFFYSASLNNTNTGLRLFFTGSTSLNGAEDFTPGRFIEIPLSAGTSVTVTGSAGAGGANTQIQFNDGGALAGDSAFVFNKTTNNLGLGVTNPLTSIDISGELSKPAAITLRGFTTTGGNGTGRLAYIDIRNGSTSLGAIGRTKSGTNTDIYISSTSSNIRLEVQGEVRGSLTPTGLGVGVQSPTQKISVADNTLGISIARTGDSVGTRNILRTIPGSIASNSDVFSGDAATEGLLIETPTSGEGGNIIAVLNTDSNEQEEFNIIKARGGNYADTGNMGTLASFKANGRHGINTRNTTLEGVIVEGSISGSGNFIVEGSATVKTVSDGDAANTSGVVITPEGILQKIAAAPVPVGGIIMWSGSVGSIPTGWRLCDGTNGTPNLRDRFIVGAGTTHIVGATGGSADAVVVSHSHTMQSGGSHNHTISLLRGESDGGTSGNDLRVPGTSGTSATLTTTSTGAHTHTINEAGESGVNKNLPPYYALAFIMYTGN